MQTNTTTSNESIDIANVMAIGIAQRMGIVEPSERQLRILVSLINIGFPELDKLEVGFIETTK